MVKAPVIVGCAMEGLASAPHVAAIKVTATGMTTAIRMTATWMATAIRVTAAWMTTAKRVTAT